MQSSEKNVLVPLPFLRKLFKEKVHHLWLCCIKGFSSQYPSADCRLPHLPLLKQAPLISVVKSYGSASFQIPNKGNVALSMVIKTLQAVLSSPGAPVPRVGCFSGVTKPCGASLLTFVTFLRQRSNTEDFHFSFSLEYMWDLHGIPVLSHSVLRKVGISLVFFQSGVCS